MGSRVHDLSGEVVSHDHTDFEPEARYSMTSQRAVTLEFLLLKVIAGHTGGRST